MPQPFWPHTLTIFRTVASFTEVNTTRAKDGHAHRTDADRKALEARHRTLPHLWVPQGTKSGRIPACMPQMQQQERRPTQGVHHRPCGQQRRPGLGEEEITPVLLERLQEATIDMALLALPVPRHHFVCQELLREPLYLVVPRNHRLASKSRVHLKQIEGDSFLLLKEGHCFRENTLSACGRARLEPNVVFESGQFATILAIVAANTGVSVVPHMAVEEREGCCFIPIADDGAYRRVGVVQLKQHFRSRAQQAFLRHLQQSAARD